MWRWGRWSRRTRRDGGGEVEEAENGEEFGEVAAEGGEAGNAADPLVHGGDVVGDDGGCRPRLGPTANQGGERGGAALGVAPVGDVLEGAAGGVEGVARKRQGACGGGDGGGGGGGDGGLEVELSGDDRGRGVVDALAVHGDVFGELVGEQVVDGPLFKKVHNGPHEAGELFADAERPPAFEGAGGGANFLQQASACGASENAMEDGVGGVGEDGVHPGGGGLEGAVPEHGFDDAIVHGEGATRADIAKAAGGFVDVAGGGTEWRLAGFVGDVGGGEGTRGGLGVEGDEGAFGVVESRVGGR